MKNRKGMQWVTILYAVIIVGMVALIIVGFIFVFSNYASEEGGRGVAALIEDFFTET